MQSKIFLSSLLCSGIVASFAFADTANTNSVGTGNANASAQASQINADGGGAFNSFAFKFS